jgi:hypothetical protein
LHGTAEEPALTQVAAHIAQPIADILGFDSLGDDNNDSSEE